jgi:hypothetical protein
VETELHLLANLIVRWTGASARPLRLGIRRA